jgi:beta-lactam-binding protein with PASTA domain
MKNDPTQPPASRPLKPKVSIQERWVQAKTQYKKVEAKAKAFAKRVLPRPTDDEKTRLFKLISWSLIGMLFLVVFLASSVFFLTLKGEEETMIPQVVGKDLASALVELQEKELTPYVQLKFSDDPREKGNVVSQDPTGGMVSKAGRRVTLWVSKGAIVNDVENFVGQNINDVQLRLKTLFSTQATPLLALTSNPVYTFSSAPEGTVLEQKPVPGTPLSEPTELVVVISKGPKGQVVKVGQYTGHTWTDAIDMLIRENKPFVVKVRKAEAGEKPGQVVNQAPAPGADMPRGDPVTLTMTTPPDFADGRQFQVLQTTLPDYPIMVDVKVNLRQATGDEITLYQLKHPGGLLTIPFVASPGDVVVVSVLDHEVYTQKVGD